MTYAAPADIRPVAPADPSRRSHSDVVDRLSARLDTVLAPLISKGATEGYALLDFPDHANVGDSAIYAGELALTRRLLGRKPSFVDAVDDAGGWGFQNLPPDSLILLHGGGNFGDIYPRHQTFREDVMARHPGRPIVQLAQSIHYDDPARIDATARRIAAHGNVTLLTRDHASRDLAERHFDCDVQMCPDAAFALGAIPRPAPPTRDVLLLLRGDKERVDQDGWADLPPGWLATDWMVEPKDVHARALRAARSLALRTGNPLNLRREPRRAAYFDALARQRVTRGLAMLSTARFVITDRLHAHILCTLMGIPHAVLDNYYGKISRYSAAFDTMWAGVTRAGSPAEAVDAAELWLRKNPAN